jgi:hypothetical protein
MAGTENCSYHPDESFGLFHPEITTITLIFCGPKETFIVPEQEYHYSFTRALKPEYMNSCGTVTICTMPEEKGI